MLVAKLSQALSELPARRRFLPKLYSIKLWFPIIFCLIAWFVWQIQLSGGTSIPTARVANIWLPSIFADNMVLQRDIPIPIWGSAPPGLRLKIKLGPNEVDTVSGADGNWSVKLPAMPAGDPYELSICGMNTITIHNVAIGDVWFCAGQSNMKMPMLIAYHSSEDIRTANYPMLRFFKVQQRPSAELEKNVPGTWQKTTPKTVLDFSAVAYYFAREIHQKKNIPIGIIDCASGGITIEAWLSKALLPQLHKHSKYDSWIFNGMVAPIIGYGIKGMAWYKGESDRFDALEYQKLISSLIQDWRNKWCLGNFPCLCIQLPNCPNQYHNYNHTINSPLAQIREAQLQCSKTVPNVYLVVTIDTADRTADVHPRDKTEVGHRLAKVCLLKIYECNIDEPSYQSIEMQRNKMIVHFAKKGLVAKEKELSGFVLAGADKVFCSAQARIAPNKRDVIVWSDQVNNPVAVRYAWADNPKCSLYDQNGLPLSPFRTDPWPYTSLSTGLTGSYWLKKTYLTGSAPPDILILGSEQLLSLQGADAYVYHKEVDITGDHRSRVLEYDLTKLLNKNWRVMVSALPNAMISDQLIVSHALFSDAYKPKLVAIALSPLSFIDVDCSSIDTTEPFSFFSKDIGLDLNLFLCQLKLPSAWWARLVSVLNRQNESKTFNKGCNPTNFSWLTWKDSFHSIYPGELVINAPDGGVFQENLKEYQRRYKNPFSPQLDLQMCCLDNLLSYLAQKQIKTIVFNLPLSSTNMKLLPNNFWKYYDERINEICRKNEADFLSADRIVLPFEKSELIDGAHLNLAGGVRWSRPMAVYMANRFRSVPFQELLTRVKNLK